MTLTQEYLKSRLDYNSGTGIFVWLNTRSGRIKNGSPAGNWAGGYLKIKINQKRYQASRLAWFYMTGNWPENEIDHIDTNPSNNKWDNLRPATRAQNCRNINKNKKNTTGFKGVTSSKPNQFGAQIKINKKHIYLGTRNTPEEAHELYKEAAIKYFGEFARF